MARPPERRHQPGAAGERLRLPDKLYFKIGEVCELTGVKQHVLRYWESEFSFLSPPRARSRQRLYRKSDVENILKIKRLLKEEGYTISGAKKMLARKRRSGVASAEPAERILAGVKQELEELKRLLDRE